MATGADGGGGDTPSTPSQVSTRRPTYRDIARAAGVSSATVSLALRDHPSITQETRTRITQVAETLGYRPNPLISALMSSRRTAREPSLQGIIALISDDSVQKLGAQHPGASLIAQGARLRAEEYGFTLDEISLSQLQQHNADVDLILEARGVTGLLVIDQPALRTRAGIDWSRYTVCTLGSRQTPERFHMVGTDHFEVMQTAAQNLLRLGYQRIGAIFDEGIVRVTGGRFEAAYALHRTGPDHARFVEPLIRSSISTATVLTWMHRTSPDAIIISDHRIAGGLRKHGVLIPDQVALAHIDAHDDWQHLAGVDQDARLIGATGVDVIVSYVNRNERGPAAHPLRVQLPCKWVDGASAPKKSSHPRPDSIT